MIWKKNAKPIKIGIAFEGARDIKPLEILIERILLPYYKPLIIKAITPIFSTWRRTTTQH